MRLSIPCLALGLLATTAMSANYCGRNFGDSKKCQTACPRGTDRECPPGERCFGSVTCPGNPGTTGSYCGRSYSLAKQCRTACPSNTDRECAGGEKCFASVSCSSGGPGPTPPTGPPPTPGSIPISQGQFNRFFPSRNRLYTYSGFASAAATFPGFMTTGSADTKKREAAAFLANIAHESGKLQYTRELAKENWPKYCDRNTAVGNGFSADCRKNGRVFQYYGRGPLQLSWNYNYLVAGNYIKKDLINNPDRVATDATVTWQTAIWFWMRQKGAGTMTPHNAMVNGGRFGETIRSINGALECGGKKPGIVAKRGNLYKEFVRGLGTTVGSGSLTC